MDDSLRTAAFSWISEKSREFGGVIPRDVLEEGFPYEGKTYTAIGARGIWKPKGFQLPLSITTTPNSPYDDSWADKGLLKYKYHGTDPNLFDNVWLREAMKTGTPLIYFYGILPNKYVAVWPVFIFEDHPEDLSFIVAIDPSYAFGIGDSPGPDLIHGLEHQSASELQRYVTTTTKQRLHQTAFRERVLTAYKTTCTLCRLKHRELLDAAHIIPDSEPGGEPVVNNGLCLCKIHHSAYDQNIIGVDPDYRVHVREDVLEEIDGPMLQYGLQEMHGREIIVPRRHKDRPDGERLALRYEEFRGGVAIL